MPSLRMLRSFQTDGWDWGHRNKLLSLTKWYYPGYFCPQHTKSALIPKICVSQVTKHVPGEDNSCTILICNWKSCLKEEKEKKPFSLTWVSSPLTPYSMKGLNWVHVDQKCNLRSFILAGRWQPPIHPLVMRLNQPISQTTDSQVTEFVVDQGLRTNSQIWASLSP